MNRQIINRFNAAIPLIMSGIVLALAAGVMGWDKDLANEDAGPCLSTADCRASPVCLAFLMSADWHRLVVVGRSIAFQGLAVCVAFAPVAYFRL